MSKIWLGRAGAEVLMPHLNRTFNEQDIEISVKNRTASGRYVEDVTTTKKNFTISYGTMKESDLEVLKELYRIGEILSLKVERSNEIIETYTVKMNPFSRQRLKIAANWYYDGVAVLLEEV